MKTKAKSGVVAAAPRKGKTSVHGSDYVLHLVIGGLVGGRPRGLTFCRRDATKVNCAGDEEPDREYLCRSCVRARAAAAKRTGDAA